MGYYGDFYPKLSLIQVDYGVVGIANEVWIRVNLDGSTLCLHNFDGDIFNFKIDTCVWDILQILKQQTVQGFRPIKGQVKSRFAIEKAHCPCRKRASIGLWTQVAQMRRGLS